MDVQEGDQGSSHIITRSSRSRTVVQLLKNSQALLDSARCHCKLVPHTSTHPVKGHKENACER